MWQIECFKHLEVYLLEELQQETDRSLLSTVPILCTFLLQRKLQLQEEGISLSLGWEMFASSQDAAFCPVVLGRQMSLCFVFHSPLSFLCGAKPTSLFFTLKELRKAVGTTFRFWESSAFTLVRATRCFKSYSLNKAMFENAQNICQMLVKYCYMIVWLISYRSSGAELSVFISPPLSPSFLLSPFSF